MQFTMTKYHIQSFLQSEPSNPHAVTRRAVHDSVPAGGGVSPPEARGADQAWQTMALSGSHRLAVTAKHLLCATVGPAGSAGASEKPTHEDVVYKTIVDDGRELLLDLYLPPSATVDEPAPLVLWVHGGGWRQGTFKNAPSWLVQHGIAVASIEQRPITEIGWPAQIDDPRDALAFLRAHAGSAFPIDPERFGAFGGSSGGHLVALLGTTSIKHGRPESSVQAVCDMFGPTDLLSMPPNTLGYGRDIGRERTLDDISASNGAVMLGATVRDIPELAKEASAFWQADGSACPFLFLHGDEDFGVSQPLPLLMPARSESHLFGLEQVPVEQSAKLHAKLLSWGVQSELVVLEGAGHGGPPFQTEAIRSKIAIFFKARMPKQIERHACAHSC